MRYASLCVALLFVMSSLVAVADAATVSLSTQVLGPGTYNDGYNNNAGDSTVELIRSIAPSDSSPLNVAYTQGASTIDFSPYVVSGATGGIFGSDQHGRAGVGPNANLWIAGDGENSTTANTGFGAHANWFITFDMADVTSVWFSSEDVGYYHLTGRFGAHGGIGSVDPTAGIIQPLVFIDGVRVDSLNQSTRLGASQAFDLLVPVSASFLTIGILNGNDSLGNSTLWDDGVFADVNLTSFAPVPEPSTGLLLGLGMVGLSAARRRKAARMETPA